MSAGTLRAFDPATRRTLVFTDYVHDGETVDVYRSYDAALDERGPWERMVVRCDGDDEWIVEPAPLAARSSSRTEGGNDD